MNGQAVITLLCIAIHLFSEKIDVYRHQHRSDRLTLALSRSVQGPHAQIVLDKPFEPPANREFETPSAYQIAIEHSKRLEHSASVFGSQKAMLWLYGPLGWAQSPQLLSKTSDGEPPTTTIGP